MYCYVDSGTRQGMMKFILGKHVPDRGWILGNDELENVGNIPHECNCGVRCHQRFLGLYFVL